MCSLKFLSNGQSTLRESPRNIFAGGGCVVADGNSVLPDDLPVALRTPTPQRTAAVLRGGPGGGSGLLRRDLRRRQQGAAPLPAAVVCLRQGWQLSGLPNELHTRFGRVFAC